MIQASGSAYHTSHIKIFFGARGEEGKAWGVGFIMMLRQHRSPRFLVNLWRLNGEDGQRGEYPVLDWLHCIFFGLPSIQYSNDGFSAASRWEARLCLWLVDGS